MLFRGVARAVQPNNVVISQVYGGGGNSGATYKNDFIEIFNPTANTLSVAGYSVQYASSTGNSYQVTALPAVSLAPGEYLLVQEAAGAGGTVSLPAADVTGSINMSATAGKVVLVSSTTALSGTCPTADPTLVDFVGFGAANCSLGSPTAVLSNTTAAIRTPVCTNAGNNSTDFAVAAPVPHNTASALAPCGAASPLSATGLAVPATVFSGSTSLLTVKVTPASSPASTGITVMANLSGIAGSTTQPFYDDGTHGDVTAADNVFSYAVAPSTTGTFNFPVSVMDTQVRTATATIALTVQTAPAFVTIRTIQATKPSTYATQTVTTSGIVVGVKSNGFYLEAKDADTNPVTPEGVLVYTGSTTLPAFVAVGAEVQLTGTVNTYPPTGLTPGTEIDGPQTFTLLSTNNPLPAPVTITAVMDSPAGGIYQFTRFEGMRVAIDSLTTTSGTDASLNETTETNTSNGRFYGVVTGVARPFREPGIAVTDTVFGPVPAGVPIWDSNPELLYIDSKTFDGPAIDLTSNSTVTGLSGVMDFSFGTPEIILDATNHPTVTGGMTVQPLPVEASNEFTIASFNMERFYNDVVDADNPGSSAVTVTTAAYQRRLAKASLAIRTVLNSPDIIGTQEIENLAVLTDLANKVNADAVAAGQANPVYVPYLYLANDGTAINTGFLVNSTRVNTVKAEQFGLTTTFTNSTGSQAILNDRTPLVLHAGIKRGGTAADYPVTVISVHQRSLINVDDPTSTGKTVRLKREAQAEYLANLIQGYQAGGEHVVTVGDYNSFEFSDGFVDTIGVTKGTPLPASQVVTPPVAGLANPPLVDLVTLLPADQRQSYLETGSAQVLDHVLVTQELVPTNTRT
jgi:predicted extracellular nuclease